MTGIARVVAGMALSVELLAIVALFFDVRALAIAILACAFLAIATGYLVYEGLHAALRRPNERR